MKKILLIVVTFLLSASLASAGMWDSMATSNWEDKAPTSKYKLDVYGFDVRVYEWAPKDNPNVRCVLIAGNNNSSGVACYPVEKRKEK